MILLVLFQHSKVFHPFMSDGGFSVFSKIQSLLSDNIAQLAVPVFFFISGYLYFINVEIFNIEQYKSKTISRVRSLLIPYLLWNGIYILIYALFQGVGMKTDFPYILEWSWMDVIKAFICFDSGNSPIDGPLWFIRDLFLVFIISPVFYLLLRRSGIAIVGLLGLIWIGFYRMDVFMPALSSLFFVVLGFYFGIKKINVLEFFKKHFILYPFLYVVFLLVSFISNNYMYKMLAENISIILSIPTSFLLMSYILQSKEALFPKILVDSVFFIFAYHVLFIRLYVKSLTLIAGNSEIICAITYFSAPLVVSIIGVLLFRLTEAISPKLSSVLTGGR